MIWSNITILREKQNRWHLLSVESVTMFSRLCPCFINFTWRVEVEPVFWVPSRKKVFFKLCISFLVRTPHDRYRNLINNEMCKEKALRASLVAQWIRIRLPMQGTWVRALVRKGPTCCGATKPVRHNYWACTLKPASHNYWARVPQLLKSTRLEPVLCNKRSHCGEKPTHHNEE